jgi:crossover junction endodeoxyribonuclease RuvC
MIKIIGIDPGLSATGIGIVRGNGSNLLGYSFGSINTSKNKSLPNRLSHIFSKILQILNAEKPDLMVLEDVFSLSEYPKSGITLGQVTGVVMLAACQADVASVEIAVREAKQVLTGNGNASKMQLEESVRHRLNHKSIIRPYHASDALGLALIGFYRYHQDHLNQKTDIDS